ncbi:MAG: hypothetical protein M3356_06800 [Actinomycetota bacterium]|nr:hypothetical protein [Actinomycetota bacterium]
MVTDLVVSAMLVVLAVPVVVRFVSLLTAIVGTPVPDNGDTVVMDAMALYIGAGIFQSPAEGYTSNLYTPLMPAIVSMLYHVEVWRGWPLVLNTLGTLGLACLAGALAYRRPGDGGKKRLVRLVEAAAMGALVWWLLTGFISTVKGDRPDALSWALALPALALLPAAATGRRSAGIGVVALLTAGFWTKQPAIAVAVAVAVALALGVAAGIVRLRVAAGLLGALAAVNAFILGTLSVLTSGWAYTLNFSIGAEHPLAERQGTLAATADKFSLQALDEFGMAAALALLVWLLVAARRPRNLLLGALAALALLATLGVAHHLEFLTTPGEEVARTATIAILGAAIAVAIVMAGQTSALRRGQPTVPCRAWRPMRAGWRWVQTRGLAIFAAGVATGVVAVVAVAVLARDGPSATARSLTGLVYERLGVAPWPALGAVASIVILGAALGGLRSAAGRDAAQRLRNWWTRADWTSRSALVLAIYVVIGAAMAGYFRAKAGGASNQFMGLGWAVGLLLACGWAVLRHRVWATAAVTACLVVVWLAAHSEGLREQFIERHLGLHAVSQHDAPGQIDPALVAYARTHSVYHPTWSDLGAQTTGRIYPSWLNLIGLLGAGRQPVYLFRALLDRRFDAVVPFDTDMVEHGLTSGFGQYEENLLWKVNRAVDARYRPLPGGLPELLYRRPGEEQAVWMRRCFGPFDIADVALRINRGGGFWCRDGTSLTLRETPADYSDVRVDGLVRQVGGQLEASLPDAGWLEVRVEQPATDPDAEPVVHWRLRVERAEDADEPLTVRLFDEAGRELAREVEVSDRLGITLSSAPGRAASLAVVADRVQVGAGMPADGGELRFASGQGSSPTFELGALRVERQTDRSPSG